MTTKPTARTHTVRAVMFMGGPKAGQYERLKVNEVGSPPYAYFLSQANAAKHSERGYYKLEPGTTLMHWVSIERGFMPRIPGSFHEPEPASS